MEEHLAIKEYAEVILAKKKSKGSIFDRITSEMGEAAIDILLEKFNIDRMWMRGRFHFDFCSRDGEVRLEVKTRKMYLRDFDQLDVRLDFWEYNAATEATHLIPVVYEELEEGGRIITPGSFVLEEYIAGIAAHRNEIPKSYTLKHGCFRVPWGVVFEYPEDFGFKEWSEFIEEMK